MERFSGFNQWRLGQVISGYAYIVQSDEEAQKLAYDEPKAYKVSPCWIFFMDSGLPAEAP